MRRSRQPKPKPGAAGLALSLSKGLAFFETWEEDKRKEKLRYIHRNPVKRGLVEDPKEWHWSSFRSYAYGEPGVVRINDASALKMKVTGRALQLMPASA